MGKCISKPVAAAVDFPVEKQEAAATGAKSSDRSLQHLFKKDVEEEEEADNGQLKRIPEEEEKPSEKAASLETVPEGKSPDTEDESRNKVVVYAERTVPVEVEKREVQLPVPTVVDKETVQGSSVPEEAEQVVTATVRPSTPEISESKSPPPDEVTGKEEVAEIHKQPEEGEVRGRSKEVDEGAGEPGEQVVEVDTQVVPEVSPREIQVNTEVVITQNTPAPLEETHKEEQAEEASADVKQLHETETAPLETPAEGDDDRELSTGETSNGNPVEDKLASDNGQVAESEAGKYDDREGKMIVEEPRSDVTSAVPQGDVVTIVAVAENPSSVTHAAEVAAGAHVEVPHVPGSVAPVEIHEASSSLARIDVPDVSSSATSQAGDPEVPSSAADVEALVVTTSAVADVEVPEALSSEAHGQVPDLPSSGVAETDVPDAPSPLAHDVPGSVVADVQVTEVPSSAVEVPEMQSSESAVTGVKVYEQPSSADVRAPAVPSSLAQREVPQVPSSAVAEVEALDIPTAAVAQVEDVSSSAEVPDLPDHSEGAELPSSVEHVPAKVELSTGAHGEVQEDPKSGTVQSSIAPLEVAEVPSSLAQRKVFEVPSSGAAQVEVPDLPTHIQVAKLPSSVEQVQFPDDPVKVEPTTAEVHSEAQEDPKSATNVEGRNSMEVPEGPRVEVPQGPSALAHGDVRAAVETQGSEQEFFEASEQISDAETAEAPEVQADHPKIAEGGENGKTTTKVDVPTEEAKAEVPREDTVTP